MLMFILFGFLFTVIGTEAMHNTHTYTAPRDYLSIKSEKYPDNYPSGNNFTWQWTAPTGWWGVVFEDFDLDCTKDVLKIVNKESFLYRCKTKPPDFFFKSNFSMTLKASARHTDSTSRGFKCHVFYAPTKAGVQSKMDVMKGRRKPVDTDKDDSPTLSGTVIALIVVIAFVVVICVIVMLYVIKRCHHQHQQQTTNTSVHVNIDGIRRASAVSYTRTGGGGARARLESVDSTGPDNEATTPKRPVKRSESNASWAERATSARNGSCSSAGEGNRGGGGGGRGVSTTIEHNFYAPFLVLDSNSPQNDKDEKEADNVSTSLGGRGGSSGFAPPCRKWSTTSGRDRSGSDVLSSILEEPGLGKLGSSFPVPEVQIEAPSISISNGGYIVMTSCTTSNYVSYDGE